MPLVEPGRKAPAFSLPDQDGEIHRLKDCAGRPLVGSKARFARKHKLGFPPPAGVVARRWDNVKVDGHAADVLRALAEL
jgi:peroxiredoxin